MGTHYEWKFLMKNVFKPEESLSRWIIKLANARNDLLYVTRSLIGSLERNAPLGENFYLFRLGTSHLREAIMLLYLFRNDKQVKAFVSRLSLENQETYKMIMDLNDEFNNPDSLVKGSLMPIRNNSFHYYDGEKGKPKKKFEQELIHDLSVLGDLRTSFLADGNRRTDVSYYFADEILFHLIFGAEPNDDEFNSKLRVLSDLMNNFIAFADDAVGYFLSQNRDAMMQYRTKK
ncbi:hypothetical protein [Cohnella luojiensis]|uniref:Uncharacterized protein n=1 Tax=Cohnella luojiensis TaxID=652876 RepID=A0A4Y8MA33_9BACL|nr:hypothetical protein [Cohnella luojiensis]TFE30817.1 hypothetical protein E2980_03295 [Cohnella luojiensis]